MNNLVCIDPHIGALREHSRRFYSLDDKRKRDSANCFMAIGIALILVSGYVGWLIRG